MTYALLLLALASSDVEAAKAAEVRAFAAIEDERWCDAVHAFTAANALAPSIDLIYNAAQAAELGGDRKRAARLYIELLGAYPDDDRQAEVDARLKAVTAAIRADGEGAECPEPAPPEPALVVERPEPAPAPQPPEVEPGPSKLVPWSVAGGGAVLIVAGGALAAVGAAPWFAHGSAAEQIREAERLRADAADLQVQQQEARASWESWGQPAVWVGVGAATAGAAAAVIGVAWGLSE